MRNLALLMAVCIVVLQSGCARWALRPLHASRDADTAKPPERFGALTALMQSQATPAGRADATTASSAGEPGATRSPQEGLENIPPELAVARLSERQGDENQSRRLYLAFIEKQPQHPLPHHRLGVMAARKSKFEEAEQHLRRALDVAPPSVALLSDLGYLFYLQGRYDEAEQFLLQALEQSPDNPSATNNLALVYGARGDFEKSLRYFRRVNDDARSHANIAFTMTQQGRLDDARHEYLHALTIDKTLRTAAQALVQIEQTRKAAAQAVKRRGAQLDNMEQRDEVIELSATTDPQQQSAPAANGVVPTPAYQPEPRPAQQAEAAQPVATATSQLSPTIATSNHDALAGRLMPLPPLPTDSNESNRVSTTTAGPEANLVPVAQSQPAEQPRVERGGDQHAPKVRPHSRFTQFEAPRTMASNEVSHAAALPETTASSGDASVDIFAQARQVTWDGDSPTSSIDAVESGFGVIPIPTTEPAETSSATPIQRAVSVVPASPAKDKVRPAAVEMGLSDVEELGPAPQPKPVRTQFSDFSTAPARLRVTAEAAPLGNSR